MCVPTTTTHISIGGLGRFLENRTRHGAYVDTSENGRTRVAKSRKENCGVTKKQRGGGQSKVDDLGGRRGEL